VKEDLLILRPLREAITRRLPVQSEETTTAVWDGLHTAATRGEVLKRLRHDVVDDYYWSADKLYEKPCAIDEDDEEMVTDEEMVDEAVNHFHRRLEGLVNSIENSIDRLSAAVAEIEDRLEDIEDRTEGHGDDDEPEPEEPEYVVYSRALGENAPQECTVCHSVREAEEKVAEFNAEYGSGPGFTHGFCSRRLLETLKSRCSE